MSWFVPPNSISDARFLDAERWYDAFEPKPTDQGDLILDQARLKYKEQCQSCDRLDDKADSLLRFAATLAALLMTPTTGFKLQPVLLTAPSVVAFLVAMDLALVARNPFIRPTMTPTANIIAGVPKTKAPKEWMAAGLHVATEELRVFTDWKGTIVERATIALCIGVLLASAVIFTSPAY